MSIHELESYLAWCGQKLIDHLRGSATLLLVPEQFQYHTKIRLNRLALLRDSTIARVSRLLNIDSRITKLVLILSACLHDVGKAHRRYQTLMQRYCVENPDKVSTKGHELLSSWVTYHTLRSILELGENEPQHKDTAKLASCAATAVLLHHHARRSIDKAYVALRTWLVVPDEIFVSSAATLVTKCLELISNHGLGDYMKYAKVVKAVLREDAEKPYPIRRMIEHITNILDEKAIAATEVMVRALAIVDVLDAYFSRPDRNRLRIIAPYLIE